MDTTPTTTARPAQLKARDKAAAQFKAKKAYEVTAVLAEKNGQQVIHNPAML